MDGSAILLTMTTEDLPGGSGPGTAHPAGVVPSPPPVREDELALLREPDFAVALRGYDREAVDAYVALVSRVIADLEAGRSPQAAIKHALDQVSEETKGILERAHETADGITSRSQAQAADRLARAEAEAREIIEAAQTKVRVLDNDADEIWRERKRLIEDVQRVADDLSELADSASRRFAEEPTEESVPLLTEVTQAPEPDEDAEADTARIPPPPPPPGS
jgi:DivIVA domain-containing protein